MKLISYKSNGGQIRSGFYKDGKSYDMADSAKSLGMELSNNMLDFLNSGEASMNIAHKVYEQLNIENALKGISNFESPIPNPPSCRDGYAFRQHVASARRNRGVDMIPEFDQFPIFYFTNANAIFGEGEVEVMKDHLIKLDFELEWAVVIGKNGKNIRSQDADNYIAGFTIMNDLSARFLQMEEMKLNLGPAKGKDFATTLGPWLVTPDELEQFKISTPYGNQYDLEMKAFHNGKQVSLGNSKDMTWTFAEIIERASYGVELKVGDVIGSGTVGTGCYLELNGTWARLAKERGEEFSPIWLGNGDLIDLEVTGLGKLSNKMVLSEDNFSILEKVKI